MNQNCVTVVCCYNDSSQYKRLQESLIRQSMAHDLLGIDNRNQKFTSCSAALNSVKDEIKTEYVIYSHQDIELPEHDMLERFVEYLRQMGKYDILGVAGAVENTDRASKDLGFVLSNVRHGEELKTAGEREFLGVAECDTVDECFFGGNMEGFLKFPFHEELCDNWHLYAVERCLNARMHGNHAYVCDIPLLHHSGGKINHAYNLNFYRIARYYAEKSGMNNAGKINYIRTVCGSAGTSLFQRMLFYVKREMLIRMHRY